MHQASGAGKRKSPKRFSLLTFVLIGGTERVYAAVDPARTADGGVTLNRRHAHLSAPEDEEDRREDADRGRQVVP